MCEFHENLNVFLYEFHLGDVFGEDYSKSPSLSEWGTMVSLAVTVPLAGEPLVCDWPDTDENQERRKFCSHHEGYGTLCDCKTIHVLETIRIIPIQVLIHCPFTLRVNQCVTMVMPNVMFINMLP